MCVGSLRAQRRLQMHKSIECNIQCIEKKKDLKRGTNTKHVLLLFSYASKWQSHLMLSTVYIDSTVILHVKRNSLKSYKS